MKKSSGFVRKGKHDQVYGSSDDNGNAYFGETLVVVGNDKMTELVMDLGGTYHMTHMRDLLYDFKGFDGGSVQLGDNRTYTIKGTVKVKIQLHDGSSFILEDVQYVPGLRRSLISLGSVEKEGYTMKMQLGKVKILHGTLPTYDTLKTIGCICYAASLKPHKDKFDPKGIKCVFMGYLSGQKGYKLYNLLTHEVFHSAYVMFLENVFPFKDNIPSSTSTPFPNFQDMVSPKSDEVFEEALPDPVILPHLIPMLVHEEHVEAPQAIPDVLPIRRSSRSTSALKWLKDFVSPKSSANSVIQQPTNPCFLTRIFVNTNKP
ncbi:zinc finger, CCHC-type containing protein [Tanacetum coccineum]